jgi:CcmD family protein
LSWTGSGAKRTQSDHMDNRNFLYMFYGFAVAWTVVVIYVLTLVSRERKLRDEMTRLKNMIETGDRRA